MCCGYCRLCRLYGEQKPTNESLISSVVNEYGEALEDFDGKAVLDLTKWDKGCENYTKTKELLDITLYDTDIQSCYRTIASTIKLDYKIADIEVKDKKASLELTYKMVDWESVFYDENGFSGYEEVVDALKKSSGTISIKGKISFVLDDGEWKISKIPNLNEVFAFVYEYPDVMIPDPTEPLPTDTEPANTTPTGIDPTGTVFPDSYDRAISAYIDVLKDHMADIKAVQDLYFIDPVGLCDIDRNGIPELFFFTASGDNYSSVLHVFEYKEYMGEADEVITVPNMITQGQAGGYYIVYVTDKEFIATHTYGDGSSYHIESEVFTTVVNSDAGNYKWDLVAKYERASTFDYDPYSNIETIDSWYTLNGNYIEESQYMSVMKDLTDRTVIVLCRKFNLTADDSEFGLLSKPVCSLFDCDKAIEYLSSLV